MPKNRSWRTRQLLTCRCVSVMLLRSMQNTQKELADAKAKNDALRDDVAIVVVGCTSKKQSVSQCVNTTASGVDNAASPTGRHRWTDYFTLRERLITMQKQLKERSILMSSADRVAHIDGQLVCIIVTIHALSAGINAWSNKTEQSVYECLLGFCFNNIFCAATNFGCIDGSSAQFQKRRNDGWWFPLVLLPVCFEQ